jgi:glycosyltransferase
MIKLPFWCSARAFLLRVTYLKTMFKKIEFHRMKFSIVTATFNSAALISSNIQSVLSQDFGHFEQIVVDNKSSDETLSIVRSLYEASPFKVNLKIISEPDKGISDAFNKGIKAATGEIIIVLSSDDYFSHPKVLTNVLALFKSGADVVHGDVEYIDSKYGTQIRKPLNCPIEIAMPFNHPTMFLRSDIYKKFGLFDENYRYAMDYEHTSRFYRNSASTDCKISYLPETLVALRAGGESCRHEKKSIKETKKFLQAKSLWSFRAQMNYFLRLFRVEMKRMILFFNLNFIITLWRKAKWG